VPTIGTMTMITERPASTSALGAEGPPNGTNRHRSEPLIFDLHPDRPVAVVEVVIPVFNEQNDLERSIVRLDHYLSESFPLSWLITIADNASTDDTWRIACRLTQRFENVRAAHLDQKGRGRALRTMWSRSTSPVVAYMDVDLSTDLKALLPLVAPLVTGHSDVAIGTRLAPAARVARGPKREVISRTYNLILRAALQAGFSDAQCGFKAARTDAVTALLPLVEDQAWFFDTELLVLAERNGLRIHEVPVDWIDDADSRVHIASTAKDDLRGVWRMVRSLGSGHGQLAVPLGPPAAAAERPIAGQLVCFASVGLLSTVAFAGLFVLTAGPLGTAAADLVSFGACTLAGTAAHRRLTFQLRGRANIVRHHARALSAAAVPLLLNVTTFAALVGAGVTSLVAFTAALTTATASAGLLRYRLLQCWVFSPGGQPCVGRDLPIAAHAEDGRR
jgi:putative flippase GtrA